MSRKGHPNEQHYVFIDDVSLNPSAPAVTGDLVNVAMWFWDTNALAWVKATGGSATGADVNVTNFPAVYPATVADGADVAQGTTTDVSGTPTTIGLLKQIASAGPGGSGAGSVNVLNNVNVVIVGGAASAGSVNVINQVTALVLQGSAPWQVAGSVAATQGGVWNVGISGTPTVLQGNAPWQVAGSMAVTQGGVWNVGINSPAPVTPAQFGFSSATLGQKTMAASVPIVIASDQSPIPVTGSSGSGSVNVLGTVSVLVTGQPLSVTTAPSGTPSSTFVSGSFGSVNVLNTVNVLVTGQPISVTSAPSGTPTSTFVAGTVTALIGAGTASLGSVNIGGGIIQVISGGLTLGSVNVGGGVIGLLAGTNTIGSTNISSGQINVIGGTVATGGVFPANPLSNAGRAMMGNPTPVADGAIVPLATDKQGRQIGYPFSPRMHMAQGGSTTSGTGETTFIGAGSAGVFHDMAFLVVSNLGSLSTPTVTIRDRTAGPVIFRETLDKFETRIMAFSRPWEQTVAASAWTMQLSVAGGSVFVAGQVVKLI